MKHKSAPRKTCTPRKNSTPGTGQNSDSKDTMREDREEPKEKKKIWSFDEMLKRMEPTCKELDYRSAKSMELNPVEKYSKLFKCTKCQKNLKDFIEKNKKAPRHPCLGVLMCEKCCHYYEDGEFSLDSDGEDKYCRWCGEGGTLFGCSQCICGFCANCIKTHFSLKFFKNVQKDENWLCFFCDPTPLWDQRYICSLAVQMAEDSEKVITSTPLKQKKSNLSKGKASLAVQMAEEGEKMITSTPLKQKKSKLSKVKSPEETETKISSVALETRKSKQTEVSKVRTSEEAGVTASSPALQNGSEEGEKTNVTKGSPRSKRRRVYTYSTSSDDETFCEGPKSPVKKFKFINPLQNLVEDMEQNLKKSVESKALVELKKVLKLSENHMSFGVSWCSDTLKKLSKPDYKVTQEHLVNECKKIKRLLSVLSTYLVQFTNTVDSLENSLKQGNEPKDSPAVAEKDQPPYATILQFLDFLNNQVKTFVQKGVPFSDILNAPVYEDENVIGLKKNSSQNKKEPSLINDDSEGIENKEKEYFGDISLGEDIFDIESDQNSENNLMESENSTPYLAFEETSNFRTVEPTVEESLITILENA